MTHRTHMDPAFLDARSPKKPAVSSVCGSLNLFGGEHPNPDEGKIAPPVTLPRLPVPSAPGSSTSEDAAEALTPERIQVEQRRVLLWFAAQSQPQTRHACGRELYPDSETAVTSAGGRINALIHGLLLEESGRIGKRALVVITAHGRRVANLLAQRNEAA